MRQEREDTPAGAGISRRDFVKTTAAAGAGLALGISPLAANTPADEQAAELAVGIIGPGSQGRNLLTKCLKIPGVRFTAVSDIWEYHRVYSQKLLAKYDMPVNVYEDYREMLAKEPALDAVIVATPDWVHAEQSIACLEAGKHVYCEKEMSNTLESAREMVLAARRTGKLLQIGHQRRSNPYYWHAIKLLEKDKVCGPITHFSGQWNRAQREEIGWPKNRVMEAETLSRYGYGSMDEFRNWRWYKKYSGGPIADLGSHQVDVFNWILGTPPKAVLAAGGLDHYREKPREWYDNVFCIYEYPGPEATIRGSYQVINTSSHGGFYEKFMGKEGTLIVSEDPRRGMFVREITAKRREWEDESETVESLGKEAILLKIGETLAPDGSKDPEGQRLLAESKKNVHQLHLENFFRAIREGTPLSCPPEVGYETAVSVLKVNEALETGTRLELRPEQFRV